MRSTSQNRLPVVVGAVLFVAALIDLIANGPLRRWDHTVFPIGHPAGDLWYVVSDIGGVWPLAAVLIVTAAVHLVRRRPIRTLIVAAVWVALTQAVVLLTKTLVGRTPPKGHVDQLAAGGMSWPSGHTADSLAMLMIAATVLTMPGTKLDTVLRWVVPIVSAAVAVSVVRLHYHWPSDVVGGWGLGLVLGSLARRSIRSEWARGRSRPREPVPAEPGRSRPRPLP
ncbi:phosphatase PAP2 family protein [Kribbella solani]|uniref:Undecaprenyl-diphosphatase n=1 Tax=Kribbella solani TaxID=236067 RepID=A0A841DKC7_9ACTN|nr:phosphatase PAP2 family protein [Kribbella solani]MBB5978351.1 undecaprenyl-diphosphatase [Kribbella solani]